MQTSKRVDDDFEGLQHDPTATIQELIADLSDQGFDLAYADSGVEEPDEPEWRVAAIDVTFIDRVSGATAKRGVVAAGYDDRASEVRE